MDTNDKLVKIIEYKKLKGSIRKPKYATRKLSIGLVSCMLGYALLVSPTSVEAAEVPTEATTTSTEGTTDTEGTPEAENNEETSADTESTAVNEGENEAVALTDKKKIQLRKHLTKFQKILKKLTNS